MNEDEIMLGRIYVHLKTNVLYKVINTINEYEVGAPKFVEAKCVTDSNINWKGSIKLFVVDFRTRD